jgi:hypothetical protein
MKWVATTEAAVGEGGGEERRVACEELIHLKRIYNFFMIHACFYTICLVFRYTSWRFYVFSGTNVLTRCHSASSLFSAIFVFQKSYTGNILGIGWNKSRTSRYLTKLPEHRRGDGTEPGVVSPLGVRPRAWPRRPMVSPTWSTSDAAPSPIKTLPTGKT